MCHFYSSLLPHDSIMTLITVCYPFSRVRIKHWERLLLAAVPSWYAFYKIYQSTGFQGLYFEESVIIKLQHFRCLFVRDFHF